MTTARTILALALAGAACAGIPATAARASVMQGGGAGASSAAAAGSGNTLESAASRAGDTGRKIAFSLIGLALAGAAIVMCFKRDFKDAIGVFGVGLVAVLLASPAGVGVLQDTVKLLFG